MSLLDKIEKREMDQRAFSLVEIMKIKNLPRPVVEELRDINMTSGAWERVWKKFNGRVVKAYREKKNVRKQLKP